jgi:PAS domain S-box-containing protein
VMENQPVTILLVDDEKHHAGAIRRAFRAGPETVEIVMASSLGEAREYLNDSTPDLVIADWMLPDGKGSELLKIKDGIPAYPLILMTSHGSEEVAVDVMRAGASDYVVKSDTVFADMPNIVRRALRDYGHIVERNKARKALKASERFLSTVLDSIQDGLTVADTDYTILRVNKAMELRYARVMPLVGKKCFQAYQGRTEPCEQCSVEETLKTGRPGHAEVSRTGQSGDVQGWSDLHSFPLVDPESGRVTGVIEYVRDITERKRAEERLLHMERLKAGSELAAGVAHHFNNMLQVVLGSASVARAKLELGDLEGLKEQLDLILTSSRLGSDTVKRLQSFVQLRSEETVIESTFDLSRTTRQAIETTAILWDSETEDERTKIRLIPHLRDGCFVNGAESELFDVITNLIKNGIEALPYGGELRIETTVVNDQVVLNVTDTGIGIPEENLGKLFTPFFTTKGLQRTGMGLAGSIGMVKKYNGTISVKSDEAKGSTFTVSLPLASLPENDPKEASIPPTELDLRVLVIDDVEPVLATVKEGLTAYGLTVFTALSGSEGIRLFEETSPDLVICDLGMPDMNGWEVASKIKDIATEKGAAKVPFMLLTGWGGQSEEQDKIANSGVDFIIEKPVDIHRLVDAIQDTVLKSG